MNKTYRAVAAALVLSSATFLATGAANAATAGNFSPLKTITAETRGGLELADWGKRCFRDCHVGRHGRTYCTWECYRPRRWW